MRLHRGFTLVEAVVVIAITAIISSVVAVFIMKPVEAYFASAQRADLTDTADTALRRIARDLRLALPNSVRVNGSGQAIEFLSTSTGGRYRYATGSAGGDPLDFTGTDATSSFDVLGSPMTFAATSLTNQNQLVILNLGISGGADAYEGNTGASHNRRTYSGAAGSVSNIPFSPATSFPLESPNFRFQVVDTPVSYICDTSARTLRRYWGYAIQASQPAAAGLSAASNVLLARDVASCAFTYEPGVTGRNGLVSLRITLGSTEAITLYHEVHVTNAP